jgi:uncharacterized membrane protein YjdF
VSRQPNRHLGTYDPLLMVGWISTAIFIGISFLGVSAHSTYRFAFIFLSALLWSLYAGRSKLYLHPLHFALFATALLLHDLGAFGWYRRDFLGLEFDTYVHFYFGFVGGLMLHRALGKNYRLRPLELWTAVLLLMLGLGAVHELIECASTLWLGPDRGMLKLGTNDLFDTQKDLLNNLLGAILAKASYWIKDHL